MTRTLERDIFGDPIRLNKINGKAKGNKNELTCAKAITGWTGEKFTRTPSSGGLRWKKSQGVAADLVCENPDFYYPLATETKHLNNLDDVVVLAVWKQVLADAIRAEKIPMAMLRINGQRKFIYQGNEYLDYLMVFDVRYGGMLISMKVKPVREFHSSKHNYTLYAFKFSQVIAAVRFSRFVESIKRGDYIRIFLNNQKQTT